MTEIKICPFCGTELQMGYEAIMDGGEPESIPAGMMCPECNLSEDDIKEKQKEIRENEENYQNSFGGD